MAKKPDLSSIHSSVPCSNCVPDLGDHGHGDAPFVEKVSGDRVSDPDAKPQKPPKSTVIGARG